MYVSKKIKRRNKKAYRKLSPLLILFTFAVLIFYFGMNVFVRKPLYISPIPNNSTKNKKSLLKNSGLKNQEKTRTIEDALKKEAVPFVTVGIATNAAILIIMSEGGEVLFSQDKDLASQISSLQRVLSRFTIEGKKFELLDFRFDRPVVKLK